VPNGAPGKRTDGPVTIAEDDTYRYLWSPDRRLVPELAQFDKIILATDGDEKGILLRDELAARIGEAFCWFVEYPPGCKDANDVLLRHGPDTLREMIDAAKPLRPGHLVSYSDIPPRSLSTTYSTGWEALDPHFMLRRPELIVVTGVPGAGKGQFTRCLAFHLAESHGFKTGFLTPEDPPHRIKADMRRFALRHWTHPTREQQAEAVAWCDRHFRVSLPPEDEPISLGFVEHEMETAALHHDCQMFVLDPWNEVEHLFQRGETETQYIERALRAFRRKIRRLNMILVIAAHPTKQTDEKVTLYSISGSANWKNKCDHGVIIRRQDEHSRIVEICIEKSKDHEHLGIPGSIWMKFDRNAKDYNPIPAVDGD
jgi:twinkle protein